MKNHILVLAGGEGKRLGGDARKLLRTIGGIPMLSRVVSSAMIASPEQVSVVLPAPEVSSYSSSLRLICEETNVHFQPRSNGPGGALRVFLEESDMNWDTLTICCADLPFLHPEHLVRVSSRLEKRPEVSACCLTRSEYNDKQYGRVYLNERGDLDVIREYYDDEVSIFPYTAYLGVASFKKDDLLEATSNLVPRNGVELLTLDLFSNLADLNRRTIIVDCSSRLSFNVNSEFDLKRARQEILE